MAAEGAAARLLDSALWKHGEDEHRVSQIVNWDQSLVELTTVTRSRIPAIVEAKWGYATTRSNCGLLPSLRHAWASVDSVLYLWDYAREEPPVVAMPADSAIISIALCEPPAGFLPGPSWLMLVVATRRSVSLVGLEVGPGHISGGPGVQLVPLAGYTVPTEGAVFNCIRCNSDGHIFLLCGAPEVYELAYTAKPGWLPEKFQQKCRLLRQSGGWLPWVRDFVSIVPHASARIRLLACAAHDYVVTVDDASTIRLFRSCGKDCSSALEELSSLTAQSLSKRITELAHVSLVSRAVTHAFLALGLDGYLHLNIFTTGKDRIHLVCSAATQAGPPSALGTVVQSHGAVAPATKAACEAGKFFFGFWLREVLPAASNFSSSASFGCAYGDNQLSISRLTSVESSGDPCLYSAGVWIAPLRKSSSTAATDIGLCVRMDNRAAGVAGLLPELQTVLEAGVTVLDISEERRHGRACIEEAPLQGGLGVLYTDRTFAVMLEDCVKTVRIAYQPHEFRRSPSTAGECCTHLLQLGLARSDVRDVGRAPCQWMWSLDDAHVPSFEEQRQCVDTERRLRPLYLGRWFDGFLQFLAITVRPVWHAPLVTHGCSQATSFFYKRRRVSSHCFASNEGLMQSLLMQIRPALNFVSKGSGLQPLGQGRLPPQVVPSSASLRSRLYAEERREKSDISREVLDLLADVLNIVGRLEQILELLCIIHRHNLSQRVLQSASLPAEVLNVLLERPLSDFVVSADALSPVIRLCASVVFEDGFAATHRAGIGSAAGVPEGFSTSRVCKELQELCPAIFAQVDLSRCFGQPGATSEAMSEPSGRDRFSRVAAVADATEGLDAHWDVFVRSVQAAARENPDKAQSLCCNKLQELSTRSGDADAVASRAYSLVVVLVDAICREPLTVSQPALVSLLVQTSSIHFPSSAGKDLQNSTAAKARNEAHSAGIPFVPAIVLDFLLKNADAQCGSEQRGRTRFMLKHKSDDENRIDAERNSLSNNLKSLLNALFMSNVVDMEAFLLRRSTSSKSAADCLRNYYTQHNQIARSIDVLLQLADWPGTACSLQERVYYLELARDQAQAQAPEETCKDAVVELTLRLDVARNVQVPLLLELSAIAENQCIPQFRRADAREMTERLENLQALRKLYQIAVDFGLFHIVLVISDMQGGAHEHGDASWTWISVFCPPETCVYCLPSSEQERLPTSRKLFPLLMVRDGPFFPGTSAECMSGSMTPSSSPNAITDAGPETLRLRSMALLEELQCVTHVRTPVWDVRCIATVLEYCNCVWQQAFDAPKARSSQTISAQDEAGCTEDTKRGSGESNRRSWVALGVLTAKPFLFSLAEVVQFYAQMLGQLSKWLGDLQAVLPERAGWPRLSEDDVHVHLSEVVLGVFALWIEDVQNQSSKEALSSFREAWQHHGSGLLADMAMRLNGLQCHYPVARRLLPEALRLEGQGRQMYGRYTVPSAFLEPSKGLFGAPCTDGPVGNPQAANG